MQQQQYSRQQYLHMHTGVVLHQEEYNALQVDMKSYAERQGVEVVEDVLEQIEAIFNYLDTLHSNEELSRLNAAELDWFKTRHTQSSKIQAFLKVYFKNFV